MENGKKKFTITLPESLAIQAKAEGLLTSESMEILLQEEMRRRRLRDLLITADRLAKVDLPPVSEEEVVAIVREVREERRSRNAARP